MGGSAYLERKRSRLGAFIRFTGLLYAIPAAVAPYLFELGRAHGTIRSTFQGYGQPPLDQHAGAIARYAGLVLGGLLIVFAKRIAAFLLPSYAPPFPLRTDGPDDLARNQILWVRLLTDARRPWRLLLLGSILLALSIEPVGIVVIVLLDPVLLGPRVATTPLTVSSAYLLLLPGLLAFSWGGVLWWSAFTDRKVLRKQVE